MKTKQVADEWELAGMPPESYRIRVEGHLGPEWSEWFGGLAVIREPDGTTTLAGPIADQAALHGVLMQVRDLGIVLVGVERVAPGTDSER